MKYGHFSVPVKPAFSGILFKKKSWEGVRWSNKKKRVSNQNLLHKAMKQFGKYHPNSIKSFSAFSKGKVDGLVTFLFI